MPLPNVQIQLIWAGSELSQVVSVLLYLAVADSRVVFTEQETPPHQFGCVYE